MSLRSTVAEGVSGATGFAVFYTLGEHIRFSLYLPLSAKSILAPDARERDSGIPNPYTREAIARKIRETLNADLTRAGAPARTLL